jgi:predicted permease
MSERVVNRLRDVGQDLMHAGRSLAKARAYTAVCVLTLGIGMAPVIAVQVVFHCFSTPPPRVDAKAPTELVELVTTRVGRQGATDRWSYPDFVALRDANTGVSIAGWVPSESEVSVPASGVTTTVETMFVSSEYFRTIGVPLALGPGFQQTADPVVVLGHAFWQHRLASDPDVIGKTIDVGRVPHVVAGIAADRFAGHMAFASAELFLPLDRYPSLLAGANARFDRSKKWVRVHGRLSPGVTIEQARGAVSALTSQVAREYPATNELVAGTVAPYLGIGSLEGSAVPIVTAVWTAMTALPLLVVCLNVSGMVQARTAMRERELSIRQAIGASRGRLMQYLLAEAVVLAALGSVVGAVVLVNVPPTVARWIGEPMPPQFQDALSVDVRMLAMCAALCLATSLAFGWLPAARFSRPVIMTILKDDAGSGGVRAGRFHRVTAALQVAIAVPLLILSFLSLERLRTTVAADLGFASDLLYAAPLELDARAGESVESRIRRVRESLATASGVAAVTIADGLPLDFRHRMARVSTQPDAGVALRTANAHVTRVGSGYFDTMGIALVRGRGLTVEDAAAAPMVTIVSRALAERLFPGADAIGQRLTLGTSGDQNKPPQRLTIVGVAADFPTSQMRTGREQLLLPLAQHGDVTTLMVVARSAAGEPPAKLHSALANAVREVDADFDRRDIVTGVWLRRNSTADFLNTFAFAGIPGGVTLLLAALGIYGVVGLMVATRTREIAVRVALGASRPRVIGMVLFDVLKLVAPGVTVGLLVTVALVRADGGITISAVEPLAYVAGAAVATLTAVAASLAPARRAASVQPMVAIRST